ncbi:hypothetical protein TNCV_4285621 [Trichonephila clavipes]|nr:hypothetical protein TNCV_4285621 [Trichonephila clavipes]
MFRKFEAMGTSGIQPGRGRKYVAAQVVNDLVMQAEEDRSQTISSISVWRIAAFVAHLVPRFIRFFEKSYATIPNNWR